MGHPVVHFEIRSPDPDASRTFAAWLHRIATNVCLDMLRVRKARGDPAGYGPPARPGAPLAPPEPELAWVEPVSDNELAGPVSPQDEVIRREEISLAFVAALQRLAPRQRAALLLHDVLGFSHTEVSETLAWRGRWANPHHRPGLLPGPGTRGPLRAARYVRDCR